MTELFQEHQLGAGEDLQAPAAIDEVAHGAPSLPAGSLTPQTAGASAPPGTIAASGTTADSHVTLPMADNVEFRPTENVDEPNAQLNQICMPGAPVPAPLNPDSEAAQIHTQFKRIIAQRTNLPDRVSSLIAFWAISTWFQEAFTVIPCLVITGPAHEAMVVLSALNDLCVRPRLLAGFKRADLRELAGYLTLLISEPNLDNRTAALLGNLTNRGFLLVEERSYLHGAGSRAVYIGEDPAIRRIQHSLYIDVTAQPCTKPPAPAQLLQGTIGLLRDRIFEYYKRNLEKVRRLEFNPGGLSPEAHAMANALGSCILDSPQLRTELVALLRPQDLQQIADRSESIEALVAGAALTLCHQGKGQVFVKEITAEVNRLLKARGETLQLSPEKVGHGLRKIGLHTRRLSQAGNGLTLDQPTRIHIHEAIAAYRGEDLIANDENLHCALCTQNEQHQEVM